MKKMILFFLLFYYCVNAQSLSNIYFLSEDIGWIQTIGYAQIPIKTFRTTNGGITWIQLDTMFNYKNIQFINDSVGYLFSVFRFRFEDGLQGKNLYKTTDKGKTWYFLTDTLKGLHNVMFADEMVGYADAGTAKTNNGGITWLKQPGGGNTSKFEVITKDKVILLSTADDDRYFITTNGGISWEGKEFPFPYRDTIYANSDRGLADIQFTDTLHGFVTTVTSNPQDPDFSGIYSTSDGGETWIFSYS
ncbi:MAG TPA: hypothetical protein VFF33_13790 [Ignavibacteriaceae bacterium]|nr:hypothetical protein [Ignavibacteriaceae bacterium]